MVVVVASWFWLMLLHQGQDALRSLNSELYLQILKANNRTFVHTLNLRRNWVIEQDNEPKHTRHSIEEWLNKKTFNALKSQSPNLFKYCGWTLRENFL